ncbi:MAG TPA: RusA family crossover junction endodeoxyribonuclease [Phycisphaerae bacterium]|nr:RusA family crossover junction endodeoxyribonuclease [Phycisphaerae bacterium]
MELQLPFPPSVNHYWRNFRGRTIISKAGRDYRAEVCATLAGGGKPPFIGRIALCMDAFPPDRRRRDLDNILKASLDSLTHAQIYDDDHQVDILIVRRKPPESSGHLHIVITPIKTMNSCPFCGREFTDNYEKNF